MLLTSHCCPHLARHLTPDRQCWGQPASLPGGNTPPRPAYRCWALVLGELCTFQRSPEPVLSSTLSPVWRRCAPGKWHLWVDTQPLRAALMPQLAEVFPWT